MPALVDSNGWISWLLDDANAGAFDAAIRQPDPVVVPAIVLYEVVRWFLARADENDVRLAAEHMLRHRLVPLDDELAISAALLAVEHRLAMADSIILATAQANGAEIWTMDSDFARVPGVRLVPRV